MPWYNKEQPTPFDTTRIEGLLFLHGDVMAQRYHQEHPSGKKYSLITFPSGLERELRESGGVHIAGMVEVPYHSSRDHAFDRTLQLAAEHSFFVRKRGENVLTVFDPSTSRGYDLIYDNEIGHITDITRFPQEAMELLPGEIRAALPPLYHNEKQGMKAVAPVKFFTPDSNWTWYATEFDGDDLFFGLVDGFEIELGYFGLSELEGVRGPLGLPIERDLYYEPRRLQELMELHQRGLGG
jgi:hypothetical protein